MDFEPEYTPEQEAFRAEVRAWLEDHVPEIEGHPDSDENYEKYRQLGRDLGAKGWLWPTAPTEYGGGGLTVDEAIVIGEEIDRFDLGSPPYYDSGGRLGGASILVWGTDEQKQRYLPPIFRGEVVTWQLLTGPEAGSDLAGTQTDARRDGDQYILNGEKIFVGGSHGADFMWTIARTDPDGPRHQNLSWFMIPWDTPGVTVAPMDLLGDNSNMPGMRHKNTVYFEDARVPADYLVGGENRGWEVATTHLELEHGSGGSVGRNRWLHRMLGLTRQIERDGRPLIEHDDVRERMVDLFITTEISRLFNLRNYWLNHTHSEMTYEGPQSSYWRKIGGLRVSEAILDMVGPYAVHNDPEWDPSDGRLELYQRSAVEALHPGATADIQKVIMARRIGIGREVREKAGKTLT